MVIFVHICAQRMCGIGEFVIGLEMGVGFVIDRMQGGKDKYVWKSDEFVDIL